jgi:hypothetical protein
MRTLESIQEDISFLSKEKDNFFTRLFSSTPDRIAELRIEEAKAIDSMLLEKNDEYKKIAQSNIDLLKDTNWTMKVTEHTHGGRNLSFTTEIVGEIEAKGFAYGNRVTGYALISKNPSIYIGTIDHLGKISVQAIDSENASFCVPKTLKCFTNTLGELRIEKDEQESALTYDKHIKSVMGGPFNGNQTKRSAFIKNRQRLLAIISDNKIKIK